MLMDTFILGGAYLEYFGGSPYFVNVAAACTVASDKPNI